MDLLLIYSAVIILCLISALHFYWVFGGTWGIQAALPEKKESEKAFTPSRLETLLVAVGLIGMSFILLAQNNLLSLLTTNSFTKWASIVFTFIFLLRAVGDFKYIGLTKRIKDTNFANYDTKLYTPLCIYLGLIFMMSWV